MRPRRFERLTPTFGGLYSIQLSYERMLLVHWMRVELIPLAGLAPEASAYTNSATSARLSNIPLERQKVECCFFDFFIRFGGLLDVHRD